MSKEAKTKEAPTSSPIPTGNEQVEIPTGNKLVEFIENVTENDLKGLRGVIEIRRRQLRGLEKLELVVAAALGKEVEKPERKAKTPKEKPDAAAYLEEKRQKVAEYLSRRGPANGHDIITNCGVQPVKLAEVMTCPYFQQSAQGYHLTPQCRQRYC